MPPTDIARSSDFHKRVFGWNSQKRGNGSTWFDDTTGEWKIPPISAKSGKLTNQVTRGFSSEQ